MVIVVLVGRYAGVDYFVRVRKYGSGVGAVLLKQNLYRIG
jgi:hypothetical protein